MRGGEIQVCWLWQHNIEYAEWWWWLKLLPVRFGDRQEFYFLYNAYQRIRCLRAVYYICGRAYIFRVLRDITVDAEAAAHRCGGTALET